MTRITRALCSIVVLTGTVIAASRPHVIAFGKWTSVKWLAGADETSPLELKVRALYVDGKLKEFAIGNPHEITERLFAVRRAFRINDSLPDESVPRWQWQRGGWLLVDRVSGRITPINLPEFDAYRSVASWYRNYVAYCGVSDDNQKLYAMVIELGRHKPVLKKELKDAVLDDKPDAACQPPLWQRKPARVSFEAARNEKATYLIRGHSVDIVNDEDDKEGSEQGQLWGTWQKRASAVWCIFFCREGWNHADASGFALFCTERVVGELASSVWRLETVV